MSTTKKSNFVTDGNVKALKLQPLDEMTDDDKAVFRKEMDKKTNVV